MIKNERIIYHTFLLRVLPLGFTVPKLIHIGQPLSLEKALKEIQISGHGALDEVEGVIYRIERHIADRYLDSMVRANFEFSFVRHGNRLSFENLLKEKIRINDNIRNNGYF